MPAHVPPTDPAPSRPHDPQPRGPQRHAPQPHGPQPRDPRLRKPRSGDAGKPDHQPKVPHLGDFHVPPRVAAITLLAVPIGIAGALSAFALLKLISLFTNLGFHGRFGFGTAGPADTPHRWLLAVLPPVGGLLIGVMARYGSEKIRGHGMPEAIEAILVGGSRVQPRVAVLKPLSAAVSIGTGGPFGAEGPIIMTGGALGSLSAQFLHVTADERKTLLVAGSAAGMAATFNTPLAAVLLAVELLLFEWRPRSYVPVAAAAVTATVVRGRLLGFGPLFGGAHVPDHLAVYDYPLCAVAGIVAGLLALAATALVYFSEDLFARLPIHWMWWPALGGVIIGVGGLVEPHAEGVGYDVIGALLTGRATTGLIVGVLVVKTLVWGLSLGSGTSGGILAPMFMVGGALGAAEAMLFPAVSPGFWALVSLAGVLGGVMRSPLTGIVFCLELTHETNAILPMIVTASTSYLLSVVCLKRSVLTEKLARRGMHLTREYSTDPLEVHLVRSLTVSPARWFRHDQTALEAAAQLRAEGLAGVHGPALDGSVPDRPVPDGSVPEGTAADHSGGLHDQRLYPVLDEFGELVGVVTRSQLLGTAPDDHRTLGETARLAVTAAPTDTLRTVANRMAQHSVSRIVVPGQGPGTHPSVLTVRHLLEARRLDVHEESHRERVLAPRRRFHRPAPPPEEPVLEPVE